MQSSRRAFLIAALVSACADPGTGAGGVLSISLQSQSSPGIVVGDTLRDSLGRATSLRVIAYGGGGLNDTVSGARIRFVPLDTFSRFDTLGHAIGVTRDTSANKRKGTTRFVADVNGLQTPAQALFITLRPDQVVRRTATPATITYVPGITADTANRTTMLEVRIRHDRTGEARTVAADTVVAGFLVWYEVIGAVPVFVDSLKLVGDASSRTHADTTDDSGIAGRRLKIWPKAGATGSDSLRVRAHVYYRSAEVSGAPIDWVVRLQRAP